MNKLTSIAISTVAIFLKASTILGFIVAGNMGFLAELFYSMSEGTLS
jgi:hypothetical protein